MKSILIAHCTLTQHWYFTYMHTEFVMLKRENSNCLSRIPQIIIYAYPDHLFACGRFHLPSSPAGVPRKSHRVMALLSPFGDNSYVPWIVPSSETT